MAAIQSLSTAAIIAMINAGTVFPLVTGNLVNLNDQVAMDVSTSATVTIAIKNTGSVTMAAGLFTFEGSLDSTDGINGSWFTLVGVRSNANTVETTSVALALVAGAVNPYAWEVSTNGCSWFRVRCSSAVTASAIATTSVLRSSIPSEPIPAVQTHAVTVSGTATVAGTATVLPSATALKYAVISAATTNAAVVKATAGSLYEIAVFNPTAAIVYVKLFDKATIPVPGTDVPVFTFPVSVNGVATFEFGPLGKRFTAGIGIAITAGPLATDVAVVAAGAQVGGTYI